MSAPADLFTLAVSTVVCIVTTVQAFIQLFAYNTTLALYSMLIIPLTVFLCIFLSILQFKLGIYGTTTMAGSTGYLAERVRNFRLIKSAVAEEFETGVGNWNFRRMYKAEFLSWMMVAAYQILTSIFSIAFIVIVFVLGSQLVAKGEVTVGDLTGFYMITGIVGMQLMQFFMNVGSVFGTFGTMRRIAQISEMIPEEENGAGKSTLFKLLTRLYEPTAGTILWSGEDIAKYQLTQWRDRFAYVFQKNSLISGTVRENITYGLDREVSEEELIEVEKKGQLLRLHHGKAGWL